MSKTRKFFRITGLGLAALLLISPLVIYLLYQYNSGFKYWWDLPLKTRWNTIALSIELPIYQFLQPAIPEEEIEKINSTVLEESVRNGAQWIMAMQEESGRYNYWYDPTNDTYSAKWDDNFLRQAGTAFSIASAYSLLGDTVYLHSAYRNLEWMKQYWHTLDGDKGYYLFKKKAKLGGIALPMLAMLEIREATGTEQYDSTLHQLARMAMHLQQLYGTGQYKSTYIYRGDYEYEKNSGWESRLYPGEAMLALTRMYQTFGNEAYLESVDWGFQYYSQDGRWKGWSFPPWAIEAFALAHELTGKEEYAQFSFKLMDYVLGWQNLNPGRAQYGSLGPLPTISTALYMEALGDAIHLAQFRGDHEREEMYKEKAIIAHRYIIDLQYSQEEIEREGYEAISLGGFRKSAVEPKVRIDNTQHAIAALMKGMRYIFYYKQPTSEIQNH